MGAPRVPLSRHRAEAISKQIQNGEVTLRRAARSIPCAHQTLRTHLLAFGLPTQPTLVVNGLNHHWRAQLTIRQVKTAADMANAGASYASICREFGIGGTELKRLGRRLGITFIGKQRPDNPFVAPTRPIDLAYMAAFVDGEGCVSPPRKGHVSWSIVVYNTHKGVMDWLSTFGGFTYTRKPKGFGRLMQYGWHLNSRSSVTACLSAIAPYMKVKRDKALNGLSLLLGKPLSTIEREYPPA